LIKSSKAVFASSVSFSAPLVAIGWGWFAGETISYAEIACLLVILTGVSFTRPVRSVAYGQQETIKMV
jgi:drug/metabolite transporter (DMT)-like permease